MSESKEGASVAANSVLEPGLLPSKNCCKASLSPSTSMVLRLAASSWTGLPGGGSPGCPHESPARSALEKSSFSFCWSEVCLQHRIVPRDSEKWLSPQNDYKTRTFNHAGGKKSKEGSGSKFMDLTVGKCFSSASPLCFKDLCP